MPATSLAVPFPRPGQEAERDNCLLTIEQCWDDRRSRFSWSGIGQNGRPITPERSRYIEDAGGRGAVIEVGGSWRAQKHVPAERQVC